MSSPPRSARAPALAVFLWLSVLLGSLLASPAALALTSRQGGPSLDLAAGVGMRGAPLRPGVGGQLSLGWWVGTYDDQYAFGKYWMFGPTGRVDWLPGAHALAVTPMFELRRGIELFVVGLAPFVAGGVTTSAALDGGPAAPIGWTARGGLQVKFRRSRFWGLSLRVEAGADGLGGGKYGFAGGVLIGPTFARPAHAITAPEA